MILRLLDRWLGISSWREEAPQLFVPALALQSVTESILEAADAAL